MDVLIIGGTGAISHAVVTEAIARGARVTVVNRGRSGNHPVPEGAEVLIADGRDPAALRSALGGRTFDVAVDFVAFTAAHVAEDIETFTGRTGQFVFISSASAYAKPVAHLPITESTPLRNPFWEYSRNKIAAEDALISAYREDGFPATIVRPSHTYDKTTVPIGGWTVVERMRAGKPVIVPGDGTSLWTLTHATDFAAAFVQLLGREDVLGEAFHITRDEAQPWDAIFRTIGHAAGAEPDLVHVPGDLVARIDPESGPGYLGDKCHSVVFDNSRIRRIALGWEPRIRLAEGARQMIEWFDADPARRRIDPRTDALHDAAARFMRGPVQQLDGPA
ncbi:MAG TPA: SDR family oxidoreductase [Propionicimonas sp.]|uniref:SDR family oxidoreductase n=1 Tax=Propionicimonas sp. TaxID=1955623 RepID=UPI002F40F5EA